MNRTVRTAIAFWFAVVCAAVCGVPANAQYDNGSVVGAVHDASGAAVPGATVTATAVATKAEARTTTNGTGDYEFPDLKAGLIVDEFQNIHIYPLIVHILGLTAPSGIDGRLSVLAPILKVNPGKSADPRINLPSRQR